MKLYFFLAIEKQKEEYRLLSLFSEKLRERLTVHSINTLRMVQRDFVNSLTLFPDSEHFDHGLLTCHSQTGVLHIQSAPTPAAVPLTPSDQYDEAFPFCFLSIAQPSA